jgi:fructose-specific phosphotransferase system IIC component
LFEVTVGSAKAEESMKDALIKARQHLLSGVSFAIPFIACGGILIALAIAINSHYMPDNPSGDFSKLPGWAKLMLDVGDAAFKLMPPVLAGYIAFAIASKPGLVPGMVGGWLATHLGKTVVSGVEKDVSAGFLGAMVAGLLAGHLAKLIKEIKVPRYIKPIMPILVIPILSSMAVGVLMIFVIGGPIAQAMTAMGSWLNAIGSGNAILLAMILGAMIAFDMGGPVNKVAFFFGSGLIQQGNYTVMGAVAAAICVPPLGMGLATKIRGALWGEEEREAGTAALAMGMIGITEGAIPFAASDPVRVIPCIMAGSMVASTIAMLGGVGDHAPHGGPIVLPVVDHKLMFVIAIVAGVVVTAVSINVVKALTRGRVAAEDGVAEVAAAP